MARFGKDCERISNRKIGFRIYALILISTVVFASIALAQSPAAQRVNRFIKSEMARQKIPGLSLAIVHGGKLELLRSYGVANLEHNVPVRPETVFQSGSVAKQFTAAAVMLLVQDGLLSLDDKVSKYIPDTPITWQDITIRNLLNGTSGLGSFGDEVDLRHDYTEEEFLELAKRSALTFKPNTDWKYSNIAYVTLGILIHKLTGKFYGDLLRERVFAPLGMSTARVISEDDIVPNRAAGYRLVGSELKNQEWVSPTNNTTADGSLYLSVLDLIKWDRALDADFPLRRKTLEQIWTPAKLAGGQTHDYGFGWHLGRIGNKRIVFHGGAWQGFKSFLGRVLDDKRTFIFLANSWDTHEFKLAQGILDIYYPQVHYPLVPTIDDGQPGITRADRQLLMQIADRTIKVDRFTESARGAMFPTRIEEVASGLRSMSIPVAVIYTSELVSDEIVRGHRRRTYLLSDVLKTWIAMIERDDKGLVTDLTLRTTQKTA